LNPFFIKEFRYDPIESLSWLTESEVKAVLTEFLLLLFKLSSGDCILFREVAESDNDTLPIVLLDTTFLSDEVDFLQQILGININNKIKKNGFSSLSVDIK
jgi:hypothetical protein